MRAVIIVKHDHSTLAAQPVGPIAAVFLQTRPGVSEIRVERENFSRVTISYRWKDPGASSACIGAAFAAQGMQLV